MDDPDPHVDWVEQGNHLHLSIEVPDVRSLHQNLKTKGVETSEFRREPWGIEFQLRDQDGHTLYYRQNLDE